MPKPLLLKLYAVISLLGLPCPNALADDASAGATAASAELKAMYEADQSDRVGPTSLWDDKSKWPELKKRDDARCARLQELLKEGKVLSGDDCYYSAMLMQHGTTTDDYLLAHILACAAAQRGNTQAQWLSAASLDRYLQKVGQPQVFGTQYFTNYDAKGWTQEPFKTDLIGDSIRKLYNAPDLAQCRERLKDMREKDLGAPTNK